MILQVPADTAKNVDPPQCAESYNTGCEGVLGTMVSKTK